MPNSSSTQSPVACPECGKPVPTSASECPGCGNPATQTTQPGNPKGKRRMVVSFGDFAREGMAKDTSLGRKIWIWFCLILLALYAILKLINIVQGTH